MVIVKEVDDRFDQWDELLALLQAAFAFQKDRIDPPSSLERMDAAALALKATNEQLVVAVDGNLLVGCMFVRVSAEPSVYLGKVAVLPSYQGQGIGRKLFDSAEKMARRHGKLLLELETRIELVENHQTFAKLGFVKVAENSHPGYMCVTSITMHKSLTP